MKKPEPGIVVIAAMEWWGNPRIGSRVSLQAPTVRAHPYACVVANLSSSMSPGKNPKLTEVANFAFDFMTGNPFPEGCAFRIIEETKRHHHTVLGQGIVTSVSGSR